jgi:hypothetical protein
MQSVFYLASQSSHCWTLSLRNSQRQLSPGSPHSCLTAHSSLVSFSGDLAWYRHSILGTPHHSGLAPFPSLLGSLSLGILLAVRTPVLAYTLRAFHPCGDLQIYVPNSLWPCYSKCGPGMSIDISWELIRNSEFQVSAQSSTFYQNSRWCGYTSGVC